VAGHRQKEKPLTLILFDGRYFKAMHPPKTQRTLKPWLFQPKIELDKVTIDLTGAGCTCTESPSPTASIHTYRSTSTHAAANTGKATASATTPGSNNLKPAYAALKPRTKQR